MGTTTVTYTWSGDGVRLSAATGTGAATTNFLVDRAMALPSVAIERDGTGTVVRTDIYGLERISVINASGGIAYEHTDALGSVTDLVSSSGVALGWTEYGPYGAVRSAGALAGVPADPFGFTGQYLDGTTGLYHMRARQYDTGTGRFTTVDPVGQGMGDPAVGAYGYAGANPVRYIDPSGRCVQFLGAAVAGALTGPGEVAIGPASLLGFALCVGTAISLGVLAGDAAHAIVDTKQGQVIPQPAPPRIVVGPPPVPQIQPPPNPNTGDSNGAPNGPISGLGKLLRVILSGSIVAAGLNGVNLDSPPDPATERPIGRNHC